MLGGVVLELAAVVGGEPVDLGTMLGDRGGEPLLGVGRRSTLLDERARVIVCGGLGGGAELGERLCVPSLSFGARRGVLLDELVADRLEQLVALRELGAVARRRRLDRVRVGRGRGDLRVLLSGFGRGERAAQPLDLAASSRRSALCAPA